VREAVARSLKRLRSDSIDLLQFHAWSYPDPSWLDALFHLQDLKREGLIRHIGVTNFDTAHLRVAVTSGVEIVSNQVSFSLLDDRARGPMTDLCLAQGGAGLGAAQDLVADEVRTLHPGRGRLGGVSAASPPGR
jgi:diketogulonate reductase-like aldo/keto reductase